MMVQKFKEITDADLLILNNFVEMPIIIFNEEEILYLNNFCKSLLGYSKINLENNIRVSEFFDDAKFFVEIKKFLDCNNSLSIKEVCINGNFDKKIYVELKNKIIFYKSKKCILSQIYDITDKIEAQSKLMKLSKLRSLMLEISQSIVKIDKIEGIYQLILINTINALEKAKLGTILVKFDNIFKVAAYAGFSAEIKKFQLKVEESFLYKATDGKMDEIKNIGDVMKYTNYYPLKTNLGGKKLIKSTITAPIIIRGELFGTINIDSLEINAFDEDDVKSMVFIKNCIEVAISNFLLYKESIYLAKHDSLTKLYNRFYLEEIFEKSKEKALSTGENFYIVIFDIDNLKLINDNLGHCVGDEVIVKMVDELKKTIKSNDVLARVGGDEFLGIFYEPREEVLISKLDNALNHLVTNPLYHDNHEVICSFSYGISCFMKDGTTIKELTKAADDKMYSFKKYIKE